MVVPSALQTIQGVVCMEIHYFVNCSVLSQDVSRDHCSEIQKVFSQSIQALWSLHLLSCKAAATGQTVSAEAKGTLLSMAVLILGRV